MSAGPIPEYALLDVWMALGGESEAFTHWRFNEDRRRTMADSWAQLMAAVRGDWTMEGDTNPPPGSLLLLAPAAEVRQ